MRACLLGGRFLGPIGAAGNYLFRSEFRRGWWGYLGLTGRLTLRTIFLDGNTFRDSPSVDKEPVSGSVFFGIGYASGDWTAAISRDLQSRRFKTQEHDIRYGSLRLMYRL